MVEMKPTGCLVETAECTERRNNRARREACEHIHPVTMKLTSRENRMKAFGGPSQLLSVVGGPGF